ncbi:RagB/SusD family nutrient uptake outer membrane protein [Algoriphagus resistens]|uniref:RagB/SusD family nutrient uptake outer membrane protein n=1 Tax=Algoriphagus resistens TaxID=1750590 RepID=UPI0007168FF2|nr:RagB/SusD family nutrient uptake outer membrane protein [Algoriphagus resistens]
MKRKLVILGIYITGLCSCEGFLDPKPDDSLVVPTSPSDVRALLDNPNVFNKQPVLNVHAGDEFFISEAGLSSLSNSEVGSYQWLEDPYQGDRIDDWFIPYQQIFYSNVALEALSDMTGADMAEINTLTGEALFNRAHAYFQLVQQFSPAYQKHGGNGQLMGVVVKESPDVNENAIRSNLEDCYQLILVDLKKAIELLPDHQLPKTRPGKAAAFGMLARVHLLMFDYTSAAEAALEALDIYKERVDFNELDLSQSRPFTMFGPETVYYSELVSVRLSSSPEVFLDTLLRHKYGEDDLRFAAYFDEAAPNRYLYRGRLSGNFSLFGGLSVGELELIAAEGLARKSEEARALELLNDFLSRRINKDVFTPVDLSSGGLLGRILEEREKELVGRGLRWSDLRRLNQEPEFAKKIAKYINGNVTELEPSSKKYVFPIPQEEILLTGIRQNER